MIGSRRVFLLRPRDVAKVVLCARVVGDFVEALLRIDDSFRAVLGDSLLEPKIENMVG